MHHPGLLLLLLLVAILVGPLVGQALGVLAAFGGPMLAAAPGAASLGKLVAPALVGVVLIFGVLVVGIIRLVAGV